MKPRQPGENPRCQFRQKRFLEDKSELLTATSSPRRGFYFIRKFGEVTMLSNQKAVHLKTLQNQDHTFLNSHELPKHLSHLLTLQKQSGA